MRLNADYVSYMNVTRGDGGHSFQWSANRRGWTDEVCVAHASGRFLTLGVDDSAGNPAAKALTVWETSTGKLRYRIEPAVDESFFPWDASLHDGRTLVTCDLQSGAVRLCDLDRGTSRLLRDTPRRWSASPPPRMESSSLYKPTIP